VFNLLDTKPDVMDADHAKPLPRIVGNVKFENVTFGYNAERPILHDINFEALSGQMFALVGATGSGKSSIVSLIARFYQPQQGPFTQTNDALTGFGRLDYNFTQNQRVSLSYHYSKNTGNNAVSTGDAISPETSRAQTNNGTEGDRTNTVVGQWTGILSPRFVIETRGQYSLENRPRISNSTLTGISDAIATTGARNFLPTTLDDYRVQLAGNATWTLGTHAVKFGGEYDFVHASQFFLFNQFGVFNVNTPAGPSAAATGAMLQLLSFNPGVNNRFDSTLVNYSVNIGNGLLDAPRQEFAYPEGGNRQARP